MIDGQPLIRIGLTRVLAPEWEVDELADGRTALETLTSIGPFDVAVVEMRSAATAGIPSGAETIRALRGAQPTLGIVALGNHVQRFAARAALEAGASTYVSKRSGPETIAAAVRAAAADEDFVDPGVAMHSGGITRRQREVLQLLADGNSVEEVATKLGLSRETVRTHAKASLGRLGARDRGHAVAIALRDSLIE